MEKKKFDLGSIVSDTGKSAMSFFGKAKDAVVKTIDQNGDGELNLKDVTIVANNIGQAAQGAMTALKENKEKWDIEQEKEEIEPCLS